MIAAFTDTLCGANRDGGANSFNTSTNSPISGIVQNEITLDDLFAETEQ
jgi:hypothetical protein